MNFHALTPKPAQPTTYFPGGDSDYQPIVSETPLANSAVEATTASVEVILLWGNNVLHIEHLSPPRDLYVGDDSKAAGKGLLRVPLELASGASWPLLKVAPNGELSVTVPREASLEADSGGDLALAHAQPRVSAELPGAVELPLLEGQSIRFKLAEFSFVLSSAKAMKPVSRGLAAQFDAESASYFALTFIAASSLLAAFAYFVPPLGLTDSDAIDQERLYVLQTFLAASAERNQEQDMTGASETKPSEGGSGSRAQGESGAMGKPTSVATNQRYAVEKRDNLPQLSRAQAVEEARTFGMIAMLSGDPNAPTAPWGGNLASGLDQLSANGGMWGATIGEASGHGGLELSGIGEGGGGIGSGVGLGGLDMGHGAGPGTGLGFGPGGEALSRGHLSSSHKVRGPMMRPGPLTVSGRIPPEVIQRTIRQNHGRFRQCYEQGLRRNPNLEGRVAVRFVINRDGMVQSAANGSSDLPDSSVVSCVISSFYSLSFPKPEGGIVTVVYPVMLTPG